MTPPWDKMTLLQDVMVASSYVAVNQWISTVAKVAIFATYKIAFMQELVPLLIQHNVNLPNYLLDLAAINFILSTM